MRRQIQKSIDRSQVETLGSEEGLISIGLDVGFRVLNLRILKKKKKKKKNPCKTSLKEIF